MNKKISTTNVLLIVLIVLVLGLFVFMVASKREAKEGEGLMLQKGNLKVKNLSKEDSASVMTKEKCVNQAKALFPAYISKNNDLSDSKIENVSFFAFKNTNEGAQYFTKGSDDACMVSIKYSVKPIASAFTNWTAGNGHEGSNGWIEGKSGFMTIDKNNTGYYVVGIGTGY